MTKPNDRFDAARVVVETLKDFDAKEQELVFRWAAESLGLSLPTLSPGSNIPTATTVRPPVTTAPPVNVQSSGAQDIKSFIETKKPRSDIQFATAVAYWYQFVAPEAEKKKAINEEDLLEACRKADRERPKKPYFTLNNAFNAGLLDRPRKGEFSVNAVGENLVAMTLPGDGSANTKAVKKDRKKSPKGRKQIAKGPAAKRRSKA
jgi:hypothetical protein